MSANIFGGLGSFPPWSCRNINSIAHDLITLQWASLAKLCQKRTTAETGCSSFDQPDIGLGHNVALWEFGILLSFTNYIPSTSSVLAHLFFCFCHMDKNAVGFPSLCLGMSMVYANALNAHFVALECTSILWMYVLYCGFMKLLRGYIALQWLLAMPFEMVFEMSQSLASIR